MQTKNRITAFYRRDQRIVDWEPTPKPPQHAEPNGVLPMLVYIVLTLIVCWLFKAGVR